jgi:LytR cell envelope-related transcriptional attenuator
MGRHQPPSNRSFYLSVAASTIRFAIIVALVLGGIVVINQAFPDTASSAGGGAPGGDGGGLTTTTTSPGTQTGTGTGTGTQSQAVTPSPQVVGVKIAVFNGTGVSGLAGDVTDQLQSSQYGYLAAQEPADAPSDVATTTLYYRTAQDEIEAQYLANTFFRKLDGVVVAKLAAGSDVNRDVQVAIFLGNDYAAQAA